MHSFYTFSFGCPEPVLATDEHVFNVCNAHTQKSESSRVESSRVESRFFFFLFCRVRTITFVTFISRFFISWYTINGMLFAPSTLHAEEEKRFKTRHPSFLSQIVPLCLCPEPVSVRRSFPDKSGIKKAQREKKGVFVFLCSAHRIIASMCSTPMYPEYNDIARAMYFETADGCIPRTGPVPALPPI